MRVRNVTRGSVVADDVRAATGFFARLLGALLIAPLQSGQGVWIAPCRWVHTWGMRGDVEVLFLDAAGRVRRQAVLAPWRVSPWVAAARVVLEIGAGTLARTPCEPGDRLQLEAP